MSRSSTCGSIGSPARVCSTERAVSGLTRFRFSKRISSTVTDAVGAPVTAPRVPARIGVRRHGVAGELVSHRARGGFTDRDGRRQMVEVRRGKIPQLRKDQDVGGPQTRQRSLHVLLRQDVDHLRGDAQDGIELVGTQQRGSQVDGDHHVRTHCARHVNGQVVRQAAIHQQPPLQAHRLDDAGHGHARPHRRRQLALAQDHRLARREIRRHGAKGDRQVVETVKAACLAESPQHAFQLNAGHQALRQQQAIGAEAQLRTEVFRVVELLVDRTLFARRQLLEQHSGRQGAQQAPPFRARWSPRRMPLRRSLPCWCRRRSRRGRASARESSPRRRAPRRARRRLRARGRSWAAPPAQPRPAAPGLRQRPALRPAARSGGPRTATWGEWPPPR